MRLQILILLFCLLLLSGCGGGTAADTPASGPAEPETQSIPESEPEVENLFEAMPSTYMFCSGAGGWSTDLTLAADGSFTGQYHDADMGAADPEKFPNGTWYVCDFSGKFTQPVKIDDATYSMRLESLELAHPADESEEYTNGVHYIYSGPYGLENAEEFLIYLPDSQADALPEDVLWAARGPYDWKATEEGTLGLYIIYNINEDHGFAEYPMTAERS